MSDTISTLARNEDNCTLTIRLMDASKCIGSKTVEEHQTVFVAVPKTPLFSRVCPLNG